MNLLTRSVLVLEENRTRAELYELWLDDCEVRLAHTRRQATEDVADRALLVVADQDFADGSAADVVETLRSRTVVCRVLATRPRSDAFPRLDADHQLVKPVAEAELTTQVRRLLLQNNYHLALRLYYKTSADMTYFEINDTESAVEDERYQRLADRIERLKPLIGALKSELDEDDVLDVRTSLSFGDEFEPADDGEKIDSKYKPDACSNCGSNWDASASEEPKVSQLGAHVWRCTACGHVQMGTDPSHQDIGSYRR